MGRGNDTARMSAGLRNQCFYMKRGPAEGWGGNEDAVRIRVKVAWFGLVWFGGGRFLRRCSQ